MPGEEIIAAELALGLVGVAQGYQATQTGLSWDSDLVTYPDGQLDHVDTSQHKWVEYPVLQFFSPADEIDTVGVLRGYFSCNDQPANRPEDRVMANVDFAIQSTTDYYVSELSFAAKASPTPIGPADDPKIEFRCELRFDPWGLGGVSMTVVLWVDQWGQCDVVNHNVTNGMFTPDFIDRSPYGFGLNAIKPLV